MKRFDGSISVSLFGLCLILSFAAAPLAAQQQPAPRPLGYPIVDTNQLACFDDGTGLGTIVSPAPGGRFFGQDAQYQGNAPSYRDNGDGTITDLVTGLDWCRSHDVNGDGKIDAQDKLSYEEALAGASRLSLGGKSDWRLPSVKELYSLIDFSGRDPSGYEGRDRSGLVPFIDTARFSFAYGDSSVGERLIDAQFASSTLYVSTTMRGDRTLFGVNFTDGRIKGYGLESQGREKTFYVLYVRGNPSYGRNLFRDLETGVVLDEATGLSWSKADSGADKPRGFTWEEALSWVDAMNAKRHLGCSDWRLPNAKELQSIVDYSRAPALGSAAIDPVFTATPIWNEAGQPDWACYWSSTTHQSYMTRAGASAVYIAFGRAMGYMGSVWMDAHGAGAQRSDPKKGDPSGFPRGFGPQGDAVRIYNYVRLVRGGAASIVAGEKPAVVLKGESRTASLAPANGLPGYPGAVAPPGPPPGGNPPDLGAAAKRLGITEARLHAALGDLRHGPPDLEKAAARLGIRPDELAAALGAPPRP